ncbi:MAG: hypothetical protein K2O31_03995 [Clostridia bacterium]|nr:hypothetical protein [Clostridia bacterium]
MNKFNKEMTKEENQAILSAKEEKRIYAKDILYEILPLLEEYFISDLEMKNGRLNMAMLNNQKFALSVEEIVN